MYYHKRNDIIAKGVSLPSDAPSELRDPQVLCNELNNAEKRNNARTGRKFICSLPNELLLEEQIEIVENFINLNFIQNNLCAIWAIHKGQNQTDRSMDNPHMHVVVSTRQISADGFCPNKYREFDKKNTLCQLRKNWADIQNRAYERLNLDVRVSHERVSDREPVKYLSQSEWQKYMQGEVDNKCVIRQLTLLCKQERTKRHIRQYSNVRSR